MVDEIAQIKADNLDLKVILKKIQFQSTALELMNVKIEELQIRKESKNPRLMAQVYQKLDKVREQLFEADNTKASGLLKHLRAATLAFIKVSGILKHLQKATLRYIEVNHYHDHQEHH